MKTRAALLIFLLMITSAFAYVPDRIGAELKLVRWNLTNPSDSGTVDATNQRVKWYMAENKPAKGLTIGALQPAVEAGFAAWQDAHSAYKIHYEGTVSLAEVRDNDHRNTVSWIQDPLELPNHATAITLQRISIETGELKECDLVYNDYSYLWTLSPDENVKTGDGPADVQSTAAHEGGHFGGLTHTNRTTSTMYPFAVLGLTNRRSLEEDDLAGVRYLYANGVPPGYEEISGAVTRSSAALFGPMVEAFEGGTFVASQMTEPDGTFRLSLPPGSYKIRVTPGSPATWADTLKAQAKADFHSAFCEKGGPGPCTLIADEVAATNIATGTSGVDMEVPANEATDDPWEPDDNAENATNIGAIGPAWLIHKH